MLETEKTHHTDGQILCSICNAPVTLETSKTDDGGKAVHEGCYLDSILCKIPPQLKKTPGSVRTVRQVAPNV